MRTMIVYASKKGATRICAKELRNNIGDCDIADIKESPGEIMVSGHTDDRPIKTAQIGSNWELSTKRAVSIIHRLEGLGIVEPNRLSATGYGDTQPIAPNDTPENRAKNRRVEIAIIREE